LQYVIGTMNSYKHVIPTIGHVILFLSLIVNFKVHNL
jgi:hypothetical protein